MPTSVEILTQSVENAGVAFINDCVGKQPVAWEGYCVEYC